MLKNPAGVKSFHFWGFSLAKRLFIEIGKLVKKIKKCEIIIIEWLKERQNVSL